MSNDLMDPHEFAERLDRSFGAEPPHAAPEDDLAHGRRRLRRRRAGTAIAALALAGIVSAGASVAPGIFPHEAREATPATGGPVSPADILRACLATDNTLAQLPSAETDGRLLLGDAHLQTSATAAGRGVATLLGDDGERWGECQFRTDANGLRNVFLNVYPTAVRFARVTIGGVPAYESSAAMDRHPEIKGTATSSVPEFGVTCPGSAPEESPERAVEDASCPTFRMTWNDRRPADVAAVRVTTPDGVSSRADVKQGYVSFVYTADMTPRMAERLAAGDYPGAERITFYDKDGNVLVDDRDPGHIPAGKGDISILNFPSLAWWTK